MGMYREVQGVKGFFYSGAGRRKLEAEKGLIDKVEFGAFDKHAFVNGIFFLPQEVGLQVYLSKDRGSFTNIEMRDIKAIAYLFRNLKVGSVDELNRLPKSKRRVNVYRGTDEMNYGFALSK